MRHRKLCLVQIFTKNYEEITGYIEEFFVKRWLEQDFFDVFDCFWHKFHQIFLAYPDMSSPIWQNFYSKSAQTVTRF